MTPQEAAAMLVDAGYAQPKIVELLKEQGINTTQPTISRIISGEVVDPLYSLGEGIISLCKAKIKHDKKKSAA